MRIFVLVYIVFSATEVEGNVRNSHDRGFALKMLKVVGNHGG